MSKVVPSSSAEIVMVPGATKAAIRDNDGSSSDLWMVPPSALRVIPDLNIRITGTKEYDERIDQLAESMIENGFYRDKPFSAYAAKDEAGVQFFAITDGHRRFAALQKAIEKVGDGEGAAQFAKVPVVVIRQGSSIEDITIAMLSTGTELTPYEKAIGVGRLIKAALDETQIAKRLGVTRTYIGDLVTMLSLPAKIRNQIMKGEVAAATAVKEFRADPKTAVERLSKAVEKVQAKGKVKATKKDIEQAAPAPEKSNRGRKPNPNRHEIEFKALSGDDVPLADAEPFLKFAQNVSWYGMSEEQGMIRILRDVKITGVCVIGDAMPGELVQDAPAAMTPEEIEAAKNLTADL